MSDTLRSKLIRLAHENPNLRADLLPLLSKKASSLEQTAEYRLNGEKKWGGRSRWWIEVDFSAHYEVKSGDTAESLAKINALVLAAQERLHVSRPYPMSFGSSGSFRIPPMRGSVFFGEMTLKEAKDKAKKVLADIKADLPLVTLVPSRVSPFPFE